MMVNLTVDLTELESPRRQASRPASDGVLTVTQLRWRAPLSRSGTTPETRVLRWRQRRKQAAHQRSSLCFLTVAQCGQCLLLLHHACPARLDYTLQLWAQDSCLPALLPSIALLSGISSHNEKVTNVHHKFSKERMACFIYCCIPKFITESTILYNLNSCWNA